MRSDTFTSVNTLATNPFYRIAKIEEAEKAFIIYGPASVVIIDKEKEVIGDEALEDGLPQLLRRARFSRQHLDVIVGEILAQYKSKNGTIYKTEVKYPSAMDLEMFPDLPKDRRTLFAVGNVYSDTAMAMQTRKEIDSNELDSFSISGYAQKWEQKSENGHDFEYITKIDLDAITICESGMNQLSKFKVIAKMDRNAQKEEDKGDVQNTEKTIKENTEKQEQEKTEIIKEDNKMPIDEEDTEPIAPEVPEETAPTEDVAEEVVDVLEEAAMEIVAVLEGEGTPDEYKSKVKAVLAKMSEKPAETKKDSKKEDEEEAEDEPKDEEKLSKKEVTEIVAKSIKKELRKITKSETPSPETDENESIEEDEEEVLDMRRLAKMSAMETRDLADKRRGK